MSRVELRPVEGTKWRAYPDGLVVYVGDSCESYLLPSACALLLGSLVSAIEVAERDVIELVSGNDDPAPTVRASRRIVDELVGLSIIRRSL